MRVAYSWLREYVDCELPPEELAEKLTMVGLAVEAVSAPVEGLDQIIVGNILDVRPHQMLTTLNYAVWIRVLWLFSWSAVHLI